MLMFSDHMISMPYLPTLPDHPTTVHISVLRPRMYGWADHVAYRALTSGLNDPSDHVLLYPHRTYPPENLQQTG